MICKFRELGSKCANWSIEVSVVTNFALFDPVSAKIAGMREMRGGETSDSFGSQSRAPRRGGKVGANWIFA